MFCFEISLNLVSQYAREIADDNIDKMKNTQNFRRLAFSVLKL